MGSQSRPQLSNYDAHIVKRAVGPLHSSLPGRPKLTKAGFPESFSFPSCITLGKLLDTPCPIFFNYKTDRVVISPNYGVTLRLK